MVTHINGNGKIPLPLNSRVRTLMPADFITIDGVIPGLGFLQKPNGLRHRQLTAQSDMTYLD